MFFFSFSFNKQDTKTKYNKSIKNKNKNNQAKDLPDQKKKATKQSKLKQNVPQLFLGMGPDLKCGWYAQWDLFPLC